MTFSDFETRLNYYFNSTSERDVYALEKFFDGKVYPTMTAKEKKELYNVLTPQYSEIFVAYALTKLLKDSNFDSFAKVCREISEREQLISNFLFVIFFENAIF